MAQQRLNALLARRPSRVVTVAVANRLARIVWAIMQRGGSFRKRSFSIPASCIRLDLGAPPGGRKRAQAEAEVRASPPLVILVNLIDGELN